MAGISEVASLLANEYNITITSAKTMVVTVMDTIIELAKKERDQVGHHNFKPITKKARMGRNPKTGESLQIPEKQSIKYRYTGDKVKVKVAPKTEKKTTTKAKPKAKKK